MKFICEFIGLLVGTALAMSVGQFAPPLGIILFIGGIALGRYIGKCIEEEREKREQAERQQNATKRQREYEEQTRMLEKMKEEAQQEHLHKLQTDYFYRLLYEQRIEEEKRRREEKRCIAEKEALRKELERRKILHDSFQYISIGGYNAAYKYDYYPLKRYPIDTLSKADESTRRQIWNFKDGCSSIGANIAIDYLEGNYTTEQMTKLVFCVIPASSETKNNRRYKAMCETITSKLPIHNGFRFISILYDRKDTRAVGKSSDTTSNLLFSPTVYGQDIILFDDLTTRGLSFVQAASELKKRGANSVRGLFIGRTVST